MTTAEVLANPQGASLVELGEAIAHTGYTLELSIQTYGTAGPCNKQMDAIFAELARRDAEAHNKEANPDGR
jgi:hypothetical protein